MARDSNNSQLDIFIFFLCIVLAIESLPSFRPIYPYLSNFLKEYFSPTPLLPDPIRALLVAVAIFVLIIYMISSSLFRSSEGKSKDYGYLIKIICIFCATILLVIIPTFEEIAARRIEGAHTHCHDGGVIQTEEAIKFLLKGENPYSANYSKTAMGKWMDWDANPAFTHNPYLPLSFLFAIPLYLLSLYTIGWYDQRFLYLIIYYPTIYFSASLIDDKEQKLIVTTVIALNPLFIPFFLDGYNDILILFWVLFSLYLLKNQKKSASFVALACACATKQTGWILLPFYLAFYWRDELDAFFEELASGEFMKKSALITLKERIAETAPFIIVFSIIILPFFLWNPIDFIDDIFLFNLGLSGKTSYWIKGHEGYGVGTFILYAELVSSFTDYFPFGIFQLLFGIPILIYSLLRIKREKSIQSALESYVLTGCVLFYFSRFFHANYLAYFLSLLIIGIYANTELFAKDET